VTMTTAVGASAATMVAAATAATAMALDTNNKQQTTIN
jgi:hypothetical protein